jgi:hypothetical protein
MTEGEDAGREEGPIRLMRRLGSPAAPSSAAGSHAFDDGRRVQVRVPSSLGIKGVLDRIDATSLPSRARSRPTSCLACRSSAHQAISAQGRTQRAPGAIAASRAAIAKE